MTACIVVIAHEVSLLSHDPYMLQTSRIVDETPYDFDGSFWHHVRCHVN
jgi:hypothetical protein